MLRSSKTWPAASSGRRFSALPAPHHHRKHPRCPNPKSRRRAPPPDSVADFSDLPFDVLARIAAPFNVSDLWAASGACRSWRAALQPLREAMVLLRWGKRFKHGHAGVQPDPRKALENFLKGADRGSAPAMLDAGLMYWEMGRKEEGKRLYRRAAELHYPAGQCNLGICCLEDDPPETTEAVKWFYRAAKSDYARAQYNLALCLHKGRGVKCDLPNAAKWYLRAAEGGHPSAMYNTSLCYSLGEGFPLNVRRAKMWMMRAAEHGHRKAQFELGHELFVSGDMSKALVYLELATRAGETAASHIRNAILASLSQASIDKAIASANRWRPLRSYRH